MSKTSHNAKVERECHPCCRSRNHASLVISSITKRGLSDQQVASYIYHLCCNYARCRDEFGRSALHMAASCGRLELSLWLAANGADLTLRDRESGYTPAHRAIYYGYVDIAIKLLKLSSELKGVMDNEDASAVGLLRLELPSQTPADSLSSPLQPYFWGMNHNYTLGTGSDHARNQPELLDYFKKLPFSIIQVAMGEMHTVMVSKCGRVWACGVGVGGRLGNSSQKHALTPQPVKTAGERCLAASVATNHSLLLLESGTVLSFGENSHHQLGVGGVASCTSPRQVCSTNFPDEQISGVCAGKFHSVFYCSEGLWVCGLNAGQLGLQPTKDPLITTPTKVPLHLNGRKVCLVASSSGAIVVSVSNGDIYILHDFQCKKIASKLLDVRKVVVEGGELDSKTTPGSKSSHLTVAILTSTGSLLLWYQSTQIAARCIFGIKRAFNVVDVCLTQNHILLVNKNGEAFQGTVQQKEKVTATGNMKNFHKFLERSECYQMKLKRVPNIYRAVAISADPKGNNFSVIQAHPNEFISSTQVHRSENRLEQLENLLDTASEEDSLHDIVFIVNNDRIPAHRYLVSVDGGLLADSVSNLDTLTISDSNPTVFRNFLTYLYTGRCPLLTPGPLQDSRGFGKKNDPLKLLADLCHRYKISSLSKKIGKFRYEGRAIIGLDGWADLDWSTPVLSRELFPDLSDITITADGGSLQAHKCVLAASLPYFHSMFLGGWAETKRSTKLDLPYPFPVLRGLVDFLYTQKVPDSVSPDDLEYTIQLLIVSDQLLAQGLREGCEEVLASSLTLHNAGTVLQLASVYDVPNLKTATLHFISVHMEVFLESRLLEPLDIETLKELSLHYRQMSKKHYRVVTPYPDAPSDETVLQYPTIDWADDFVKEEMVSPVNKKPGKSRKKSNQKSSNSISVSEVSDSGTQPKAVVPEETVEVIIPTEQTVDTPQPLWEQNVFPSLNSPVHRSSNPKPIKTSDSSSRMVLLPKMSQKQRKKLLSESEKDKLDVSTVGSPPRQPRGWAIIPQPPQVSPGNISSGDSPQYSDFHNIMSHDVERKKNWVKMKSKSLYLTQIEDKAIDDLLQFYNVDNEFDERITVERMLPTNVDQPMWVKSNKKLF